MFHRIFLHVNRFLELVRVETLAVEWWSFVQAAIVSVGVAITGSLDSLALTSPLTATRFGFAALAAGVCLVLENEDGEAGAALPLAAGLRLAARLIPVGAASILISGAMLQLGDFDDILRARLGLEMAVLFSTATAMAAVGRRLWTTNYAGVTASPLVGGFVVTWLIPADSSPWWTGDGPEPPRTYWYLALLAGAIATYLFSRPAGLLEPTAWIRRRRRRAGRLVGSDESSEW